MTCDAPENVWTLGLDGVQVLLVGHQTVVYEEVASLRVVEVDKQTPVDEPGALLQRLQGVRSC